MSQANTDLAPGLKASMRAFPEQIQAAVDAFARGDEERLNIAQQIATAWSLLAREGIERSLRLATELSRARTLPEMAEVQARLLRETMDAMTRDAQRITQLLYAGVQPQVAEAAPDLATRAMRSGLAHAGEPPDYGADNEST